MKNTIYVLALLAVVGCQTDPTESVQYKQLVEDKELLQSRAIEKDASMEGLFDALDRISNNINEIRVKQTGITSGSTSVEGGVTVEDQIMADLQAIDELMIENEQMIASLKKQTRKGDLQIKSLERTITNLEMMIAAKDGEIVSLKEQLSSANSSLATLIEMYKEKSQLADSREGELNRAYFAIGTAKELKENNIITKSGGVAGVGGAKTINLADLNKGYFEEVDITKTTEIPILAKKAKLITNHPEGSYEFTGEVTELVIKDAAAFWSISKYLVIQVN